MGTLFTLTALAPRDPAAAFRAAFYRIAALDDKLSDYKPESELNRFCRLGQATLSDDLLAVLAVAQELAADSGGAFDITEGPVIRLWRIARREKRLPSPAALIDAADRTGHTHLVLGGRTATLDMPGMQLDLGGIAKGYAASEALSVLARHGVPHALAAASGDLAIGSHTWRVGIGGQVFALTRCAVSTSGDTEQFAQIDGSRYSHIVDPHTHTPLTERIAVSVIAPSGMLADGLATALSVLGPERGLVLLRRYPGAHCWFTTEAGQVRSPGFPVT